jgi:hypothetical protein
MGGIEFWRGGVLCMCVCGGGGPAEHKQQNKRMDGKARSSAHKRVGASGGMDHSATPGYARSEAAMWR